MNFKPQYDADVFVIGPTGVQHLNPHLYATLLSAQQLADQLASLKPKVLMAYPFAVAPGSHFRPNKKVPHIQLPSGYTENAGSIQAWWERAPEPDGLALRYCMAQIAADEAAWIAEQQVEA